MEARANHRNHTSISITCSGCCFLASQSGLGGCPRASLSWGFLARLLQSPWCSQRRRLSHLSTAEQLSFHVVDGMFQKTLYCLRGVFTHSVFSSPLRAQELDQQNIETMGRTGKETANIPCKYPEKGPMLYEVRGHRLDRRALSALALQI